MRGGWWRCYKRRWPIEEFHKGLKTGAGVERSQLGMADKLMAWCAVLSVVTTWLLRQKLKAAEPEQPPLQPGDADAELLALLERRGLTIWRGWPRLQHQLIGYRLAMGRRSGERSVLEGGAS